MGCISTKHTKHPPGYEDPKALATKTAREYILANGTFFSVSEVEALYELYKKLSCSIINDGLIHKEEFHLALFRNSNRRNLFADRVFDLFDVKCNGVIEFGEFVQSLSIFHPDTPQEDKTAFLFRLYDLRQTGCIERDETFSQADSKGDGRIDLDEWKEFAKKYPSLLRNMTLPYLKDITMAFPSFVMHSEVKDEDMTI